MKMFNVMSFLLVLVLLLSGAIANWCDMKLKKQVGGNLFDYIFADHPLRSFASGSTLFGAAVAMAFSESAKIVDPILILQQIYDGIIPATTFFMLSGIFTTGWIMDKLANKGGAPT